MNKKIENKRCLYTVCIMPLKVGMQKKYTILSAIEAKNALKNAISSSQAPNFLINYYQLFVISTRSGNYSYSASRKPPPC